jgi:hypothetical protein
MRVKLIQTRAHPENRQLRSPLPRRPAVALFLLGRHSRPPAAARPGRRRHGGARGQGVRPRRARTPGFVIAKTPNCEIAHHGTGAGGTRLCPADARWRRLASKPGLSLPLNGGWGHAPRRMPRDDSSGGWICSNGAALTRRAPSTSRGRAGAQHPQSPINARGVYPLSTHLAKARRPKPQCCLHDTTGKTLRPFRNSAESPALAAKIFVFPKFGNHALTHAVPRSPQRRFAVVTKRGAGCDGRGRAARRAAQSRTVKPCGPDPPTLGSSDWR